jgi:hypothetical protein
MPGGDGTGPLGMGPMTGRGAGSCVGTDIPGSSNMPPGRGRGMGFGRGRGFGRGMCRGLGWLGVLAAGGLVARTLFGAASKADEKTVLTEQATAMEGALANIKQRLSELDRGE